MTNDIHGGKRVRDLFYKYNVTPKEIPKAIWGPKGIETHEKILNLWDQRLGNCKDDTIRWFHSIIEICRLNKKPRVSNTNEWPKDRHCDD